MGDQNFGIVAASNKSEVHLDFAAAGEGKRENLSFPLFLLPPSLLARNKRSEEAPLWGVGEGATSFLLPPLIRGKSPVYGLPEASGNGGAYLELHH